MLKPFLLLGSILVFLAVALGAFGAHGLESQLSAEMLRVYQTGVQYHMIHALGILLIAVLSDKMPKSRLLSWAGWLMFAGIVFFSGSLYALSMSGIKILGAITPVGGLAFLAAWALLAAAALKERK